MTKTLSTSAVDLFSFFGVDATLGKTSDVPERVIYRPASIEKRPMTNGLYEPYAIQAIEFPGARRHPVALVETGALASVRPPLPKARPILEPSIISKGTLSAEQLEEIVYAQNAHERFFTATDIINAESGQTKTTRYRFGYACGKGTGFGKGRLICGIMRANLHEGRKRHVWLSLKRGLATSAVRDWVDLGGSENDVVRWENTKIGQPIKFERGILFGSYALLRAEHTIKTLCPTPEKPDAVEETVLRRLDDLIACLGDDFDGVIAMDESQAGINADPSINGEAAGSQQGRAIVELQKRLPNARFVFVSATALDRLSALSYMFRLGLWANESEFENRNDFLKAMDEGGIAAMEAVARHLKSRGLYSSASLSYEGVGYDHIVHDPTPEQLEQYNSYVSMWRAIETGFIEEFIRLGALKPPTGGRLEPEKVKGSPYSKTTGLTTSARLRFFSQTLLSMMAPTLLRVIQERLDAEYAVLIQITHTNEAALDRALNKMEEGESLEFIDISHRDFLVDFVRKNYPIHKYQSYYNDKNEPCVKACEVDGKHVVDPAAERRREKLISDIQALVFPDTFRELLYDTFPDQLAEVSGAKQILARVPQADGSVKRTLIKRGPSANQTSIKEFQDGKKLILMFTEGAGGTGESFHSSITYKNQRPRYHLLGEMSWSAIGAVQGMGRSLRVGQVCAPTYGFPRTTLPAHRRLISTPARKIAQLGAFTRGQREAADNGLFKAEDCLETRYAEEALRRLIRDIAKGACTNVTREAFFLEMGIDAATAEVHAEVEGQEWFKKLKKPDRNSIRMTQFLNRLMTASVDTDGGMQQRILDALLERLEGVVTEAIEAGTYDVGVEVYKPETLKVLERETLHVDPFGSSTELVKLHIEEFPWGRLTWTKALAKLKYYRATPGTSGGGFVRNDAGEIELHVPVRHVDITETPRVRVIRPIGERTRELHDGKAYHAVNESDAEALWHDAYNAIPKNARETWAVVGDLIPVWRRIPAITRVLRMQTDDGERLLGRLLNADETAKVRRDFGLPALVALPTAA